MKSLIKNNHYLINSTFKIQFRLKEIISKSFANNVVSFPNSLKEKNPKKVKVKREDPIAKILKTEKMIQNNSNEIKNFEMREKHKVFIEDCSKRLTVNYFKIYDNTTENSFSKLQNFCHKTLSNQEVNRLIFELQNCKDKLSEMESDYNEAVFKVFLDKINSLTQSTGKIFYIKI